MDIRSFGVKVLLVVFDSLRFVLDPSGVISIFETKGFSYAKRIQVISEVFKFKY